MSMTYPNPITKAYSNTGDNLTPPVNTDSSVANQEIGFPPSQSTPLTSGGIPFNRPQFNGVLNFYTEQILAFVSGWRPTFNQALSDEQGGYPMGAVLYAASNNSLQMSLVDNNTANFVTTPSYLNDGVNWTATVIDDIFCENIAIKDNGQLALLNSANTHGVTLQAPTALANDQNYTLPSNYPTNNNYLLSSTTAGTLSWAPVGQILVGTASGVTLPTVGTIVNVTSVTLPVGLWILSLQSTSTLFPSSATYQNVNVAISLASASYAGTVSGVNLAIGTATQTTIGNGLTLSITNYPLGINSPSTPVYFVASVTNNTGPNTAISGILTAVCIGNFP